jgi:hypothetical protein
MFNAVIVYNLYAYAIGKNNAYRKHSKQPDDNK